MLKIWSPSTYLWRPGFSPDIFSEQKRNNFCWALVSPSGSQIASLGLAFLKIVQQN